MQLKPILASLRHHKLTALLLALQVAFSCAIITNAVFLIVQRVQRVTTPSGLDERALSLVEVTDLDAGQNPLALHKADLAALRKLPGVESAALISNVPFSNSDHGSGGCTSLAAVHAAMKARSLKVPGCARAEVYSGTPGTLDTLGLKLVAGRAPQPDDFQPMATFAPNDAQVVVSRVLAEHLWPGVDPLGKEFWCADYHFRVMGVVAHMARPAAGEGGTGTIEWSVFVPTRPGYNLAGTYLLRADPKDLPHVLRDAKAAIPRIAPDVVLDHAASLTISELREHYFRGDRVMAGMLVGVIAALLGVTALGIVGLTSFWVAQRRKQIGVRRAIGATRGDILRYFQTENFLIVTFGVALGMLLAFALNAVLMQFYELPHLPLYYLPVGAVALWLLGQFAVLGPALRAAAVPPVVATRAA